MSLVKMFDVLLLLFKLLLFESMLSIKWSYSNFNYYLEFDPNSTLNAIIFWSLCKIDYYS